MLNEWLFIKYWSVTELLISKCQNPSQDDNLKLSSWDGFWHLTILKVKLKFWNYIGHKWCKNARWVLAFNNFKSETQVLETILDTSDVKMHVWNNWRLIWPLSFQNDRGPLDKYHHLWYHVYGNQSSNRRRDLKCPWMKKLTEWMEPRPKVWMDIQ
jgi:hypothetical protein